MMMQLIRLIWVSLFITIGGAQAQNLNAFDNALPAAERGSLSGKVIDAKGQPLAGATIFIHDIKVGAVADAAGQYKSTTITAGKYLVEVSYQGYGSVLELITINQNTVHDFTLNEKIVEQDGVTVTGVSSATKLKQSPQPVKLFKKSDLLQATGNNIMESLSKAGGVSILTTGPAVAKPVIRGLGYNRVVTINDGIRQEGQQWGDEHGIEVDEYSVQKAEILKGPASLMYGSDAMAGVVNLITHVPVEQGKIKGNVSTTYMTNNNLIGTHAMLGGNQKNGFSWNLYGSTKSAADYRNKYDGRVFGSRFNERNAGAYLGINKHWGYSHISISNVDQKVGMVEGERDATTGEFLIFPETADERIATKDELNSRTLYTPYQHIKHFKVTADNSFSLPKGRLAFTIGYQRNQRLELADHTAPGEPELYFDLNTVNYNLQYHLQENNGWKSAIGINGMFQQNKNKAEEVLIPEYNQTDVGLFAVTRKSFKKLTLSGGVRADIRRVDSKAYIEGTEVKFNDFKKDFSNISGSAGISYEASKSVVLKANVARGFRAPNMAELASNGTHEGTNRFEYGSLNLTSETSLQFDAGVEINSEHVSVNLTAFHNNINNYIYYRKLESVGGGDSILTIDGEDVTAFRFDQAGARLSGVEVNVDFHPHPVHWLHIENSFSFVAGRLNETLEGTNRLPFMPPARLLTEVRADIAKAGKALRNMYVKVEMDNVSRQGDVFTAYNTETETPGFTLFNIGVGGDVVAGKKKLFSLYLTGNNITDVAYQNHLSRLKYTATNNATGRNGVFNMGRNFTFRLNVPLDFSKQ